MDQGLVSIIMPAFNADRFISEAIESVIYQTYANWELLIIDDGSTDGTATIAKSFASSNRKIKYLYQPNGKQGKARNLGIANSTGYYVAFLDADDLWTSDKLAVQVALLQSEHNIDLVFSRGYHLAGKMISDFDVLLKNFSSDEDFEVIAAQNPIPILSVILKKSILSTSRPFSEDLNIQNAEDYHLWLKLFIHKYTFKSIPDRLFYYRAHDQQVTYQNQFLDAPLFYTFLDIYDYAPMQFRKIIIEKLKWKIFDGKFYEACICLFRDYFRKKNKFLAACIYLISFSRAMLNRKIIFKLVSKYA
ncbi:glycosyltransferase family 2 protein [Pedobacter sandarakinus]|uniref:glycosyltransferase family 2 protein n=1 Tax=Pedobacter sandarakinus TaxID=353156 RepID=UPI00224856EA|nr:glycosyltransferase [Pedobacter sandarakinus]MCX2575930.1 glycosyltransferase [Pedobacter sandarakinus]